MSHGDYTDALEEIPWTKGDDPERSLNKEEFLSYRKVTGQLLWLNSQSRPDLSFDSLMMSTHNKDAKVRHINEANKNVRKAKSNNTFVKFRNIGNFEQLKVLTYTDASYLTLDDKTRSTAGKVLFLSNQEEKIVSPLIWKSKTIPRVCTSAKAAETRASYMACDDTIFIARTICEIYTGQRGEAQIETTMKTDSQSLIDTLQSTKQIEEKILRPTIQAMKDFVTRKEIERFDWVETNDCHADVLTKKGARSSDKLLSILRTGVNQ